MKLSHFGKSVFADVCKYIAKARGQKNKDLC